MKATVLNFKRYGITFQLDLLVSNATTHIPLVPDSTILFVFTCVMLTWRNTTNLLKEALDVFIFILLRPARS